MAHSAASASASRRASAWGRTGSASGSTAARSRPQLSSLQRERAVRASRARPASTAPAARGSAPARASRARAGLVRSFPFSHHATVLTRGAAGMWADGCGGTARGTCRACIECGAGQFRTGCTGSGITSGRCDSCARAAIATCGAQRFMASCDDETGPVCSACYDESEPGAVDCGAFPSPPPLSFAVPFPFPTLN